MSPKLRCAILDDYLGVALSLADWGACGEDLSVTAFQKPLIGEELIETLSEFEIVCLMRERTAFGADVISRLKALRLIVTRGMQNDAIDVGAARAQGIAVCGTVSQTRSTAELVFAHMLEFARGVGEENRALKAGRPWQSTLNQELEGHVLGVIGLGALGARVARIGQAFGMDVVAWSQNLTEERCRAAGVRYAPLPALLAQSDYVSIHLRLGERSRGLIGAAELAQMKPGAFLVNTSRGPIVDEAALLAALSSGQIGGAGLDVFDIEPLPLDHPLRREPRAQITPHLGYSTEPSMRAAYEQMVENIQAFVAGQPIRVIVG